MDCGMWKEIARRDWASIIKNVWSRREGKGPAHRKTDKPAELRGGADRSRTRGIHLNLILSELNEKSTNKRRILGLESKKMKWILVYFGQLIQKR